MGDQLEIGSNFSLEDNDDIRAQLQMNSLDQDFVSLGAFLSQQCKVPPGESGNISCKGVGSWKLSSATTNRYFQLMDQCRAKNIIMHYAEKQDPRASGIMIDLDIDHYKAESQLTDNLIREIVTACIEIIYKTLKHSDDSFETHVGVLTPKAPRLKANKSAAASEGHYDTSYYREGLHLLFPGLYISRPHKKYIMRELKKSGEISEIIKAHNITMCDDCEPVDEGCAACPVYFVGNCKPDPTKVPDVLSAVYKVVRRRGKFHLTEAMANFVNCNQCFEFSLNWRPRDATIPCQIYDLSPELESEIRQLHDTNYEKPQVSLMDLSQDDIRMRGELDVLRQRDSQVSSLAKVVDCLGPHRSSERRDWYVVLMCLASASSDYKIIAELFSLKCPEKFNKSAFDRQWEECVAAVHDSKKKYSIATLYAWAKKDNPQKFAIVQNKSVEHYLWGVLVDRVIDKFENIHIAKALVNLIGNKFVTTILPGQRSRVWFEMIYPDDADKRDGEVFKYRNHFSNAPASLEIYISETLTKLFVKMFGRASLELNNCVDSMQKKYWTKRLDMIKTVNTSLYNSNFVDRCLNACSTYMYSYTFGLDLDKTEEILGVGNGILVFHQSGPELVATAHDYPITKYTEVAYFEYDPRNPHIIRAEKILRDIFPDDEQDTYEFIMMYLALGITGFAKPEMLLILYGNGRNGKTMLKNIIGAVFGDDYSCNPGSGMLSNTKIKESGPNTSLMALEGKRYIFFDEFSGGEIDDYNLKAMLNAVVSGNDKHEKEKKFKINGMFFGACNIRPKITCHNYGTWRRLITCIFKMMFRAINAARSEDRYDPNNPHHRVIDESIDNNLIKTPEMKQAFLSIFVKWYYICLKRYGCNIETVPKFHIDKETYEYSVEQDHFSRFINERIVKCTESERQVPIESFIQPYNEFYASEVGNKGKHQLTDKDIIRALSESHLSKIARILDTPRGTFVVGYRPLAKGTFPNEGEQTIGHTAKEEHKFNEIHFKSVDFTHCTLSEWLATYADADVSNEDPKADADSEDEVADEAEDDSEDEDAEVAEDEVTDEAASDYVDAADDE